MTPTIVLRDGKLYLVVGAPGGPTIINAVLQVILNVVDFGMNVQDAVDAPRIHHQWMPDELYHGARISRRIRSALLKARGHDVEVRPTVQGEVEAILVDGRLARRAPPIARTEGTAKGY